MFTLKLVCINFCVHFHCWRTQLSHLATLRATLTLSRKYENKCKHIWWGKLKILVSLFFIFSILVWIVLENFVYWKSFLVWCREFYPLSRIFYSVGSFIQGGEFYLLYWLLSSVENFIQCREFVPLWRMLSST